MDDEPEDGDATDPKGLPEPDPPDAPNRPEERRDSTPDPDGSRGPTADPGSGADADADPEGVDAADAVPDDLPADVESSLTQLIEAARTALREGRTEEALSAVDTARTVARNKLAAGEHRDRLLHGCDRVDDLATADPSVAAAYLDAMRRRLP